MYNCTSARPSIEGNTTEDSKEIQTETLELTATALANGIVKADSKKQTRKQNKVGFLFYFLENYFAFLGRYFAF